MGASGHPPKEAEVLHAIRHAVVGCAILLESHGDFIAMKPRLDIPQHAKEVV